MNSDDEGEVPVHLQKAKNLQFEKNTRGDFVLPPLSNYRTVREKQRVVRGYIGAVYSVYICPILFSYLLITWTGKSTGNRIASFPYILASKENQTVFDPQCVPENFVLSDPDHLHGSQIISLYIHWLARQAKKLPPFIILKSPIHQEQEDMSAKARGKRKMEYVEVNSEDEEVKSMGEEGDRLEGDPSDDDEDDFGEKVVSAGVKVGPPMGNNAALRNNPRRNPNIIPR